MQRFISLFLLLLTCLFIATACNRIGIGSDILEEISGVWRGKNDAAMVYIVYKEKQIRMLINDVSVPVSLGEVDKKNKTVNLNVTLYGKQSVWTLRQVWDKDNKTFHLVLTMHDGMQDDLLFVRKISSDDLNKIANAEAVPSSGKIGSIVKPDIATPPQSQTNAAPINSGNSSLNGNYPEASTRMLNSSDFVNKSAFDLKIMRNEIFARHGYIFKTDDMKNYFSSQSWYSPRYPDVTKFLSKIENENVKIIKNYEMSRK